MLASDMSCLTLLVYFCATWMLSRLHTNLNKIKRETGQIYSQFLSKWQHYTKHKQVITKLRLFLTSVKRHQAVFTLLRAWVWVRVSQHGLARVALNCSVMLSECYVTCSLDWIVQCFTSRQHSIGYMGDGFYRSKDPTNSIKVLKENLKGKQLREQRKHKIHICIHTQNSRQIQHTSITQQVP